MAQVFLSYDREDSAKARQIAAALEQAGHSVWWDRHIKGGAQYSKEIEQALKRAEAVVVLWSERSVESAWVRDEAAAGRDTGRLVPIRLDPSEPPLGFRQYQTIDLSRWKGRAGSKHLKTLIEAIEALNGRAAAVPVVETDRTKRRNLTRPMLIVAAAIAVLALTFAGWRFVRSSASIPTIAVAAAETSPLSQVLARDLLSKLGSLHAAQTDLMRLTELDERSGQSADLVFEVSGTNSDRETQAHLVLLSGKDHSLLWAREFQQPAAKMPDLKQQVAFTAAKVLECAVEGLAEKEVRIRQETLKLYLNGCSSLGEMAGADRSKLAAIFTKVIADEPRFEPAWAKLLLAESEPAAAPAGSRGGEAMLRKHLAEAKRMGVDVAEQFAAEAALLPMTDHLAALRLYDRGLELHPDNAFLHRARSQRLLSVGRMTEAVESARRARQLDPLSPAAQQAYVFALAYSGNIDVAEQQLREAEQVWPGASNIVYARYRFDLRFGDPANALKLIKAGWGEFNESAQLAFLAAREKPTRANVDRAIAEERTFQRKWGGFYTGVVQAMGAFGRTEQAVQFLLGLDEAATKSDPEVLFRPALRQVRQDPRFMRIAARFALVEYWRTSGSWPDFCFEPDLPYDCKAEAAKLS